MDCQQPTRELPACQRDLPHSIMMWHRSASIDARTGHLNSYSTPQNHLWHPQTIFDTQKATFVDTGAPELTQSQASEICHTLSWCDAGARALTIEQDISICIWPLDTSNPPLTPTNNIWHSKSHIWHRSHKVDTVKGQRDLPHSIMMWRRSANIDARTGHLNINLTPWNLEVTFDTHKQNVTLKKPDLTHECQKSYSLF